MIMTMIFINVLRKLLHSHIIEVSYFAAGIVAHLASDAAEWVSGITIPVNGGSRIAIGYLAYLRRVAKGQG